MGEITTDMPIDVDGSHGAQGPENDDHGNHDPRSGHRGRRYGLRVWSSDRLQDTRGIFKRSVMDGAFILFVWRDSTRM